MHWPEGPGDSFKGHIIVKIADFRIKDLPGGEQSRHSHWTAADDGSLELSIE